MDEEELTETKQMMLFILQGFLFLQFVSIFIWWYLMINLLMLYFANPS